VPQKWAENPALGEWVNSQRKRYREGLGTLTLRSEREEALRELAFNFAPYEDVWEAHYERLKAYAQAHGGDTRVPRVARSAPPEVRKLGEWLHRQRKLQHAGKLAAERVKKLEELGVQWSTLKRQQP
jgi:hypothetical protein